jgi:hypothetical protein
VDDYIDRDGLLSLGLDEEEADALLAASPLTGNEGRRVIEAERLPELLEALHRRDSR